MSGAERVLSRGGPVQVCRELCNEVCNPITHLSPRTAPPHLEFLLAYDPDYPPPT
jgi:hypothetical protein